MPDLPWTDGGEIAYRHKYQLTGCHLHCQFAQSSERPAIGQLQGQWFANVEGMECNSNMIPILYVRPIIKHDGF